MMMAGLLRNQPRLLLRLCAIAVLVVTLGTIALLLATPIASIDFDYGQGAAIDVVADGRRTPLPGDAMVRFRSAATGERLALPATLLPGIAEPRGTRAENRDFWARRDRLAAWLRAGPVVVSAAGHRWQAATRPRLLADLSGGFWLSTLAGAAAALAGLWVWVLRPARWAPAMFGISGAALFVGCITTAINVSHGLALGGVVDRLLMIANYYSGVLCAGALAALFARFPLVLLGRWALWPLAIVNLAAGLVVQFDLVPGAVDVPILVVMADSLLFIGLLAVQGWRVRHDPAGRAQLAPIAIGAVVPTILFCLLTMVGQLAGGAALVQPDWTAPLLLMIYLGLGLSVARAGLFALGRRSLELLFSAGTILLFVVIEAVMLAHVTGQRDLALLLSAILVAIVYLPAREWLLRRVERRRYDEAGDLLQHAGDVALAPTAEGARLAWRGAAAAIFKPLEIASADRPCDTAEITDGGHGLLLPGLDPGSSLHLRWPAGGGRIFEARDIAIADRFGRLVRRLIEGREAYLRGVTEERGRIARDLHDDVSARLLTSLHRGDIQATHADVRDAMADIRTIVTGLSGIAQPLDRLLAGLRHETQARLEAAGIAMEWPLAGDGAGDSEDLRLDYRSYRHLLSIVRESISNLIRHSGAGRARILVTRADSRLTIEIADNGRGPAPGSGSGHGLRNAALRAESVGGAYGLLIEAGWTIARLELPIAVEANLAVAPNIAAAPNLANDPISSS